MDTITVFLLIFLSRVQMVNMRYFYNLVEKAKKIFPAWTNGVHARIVKFRYKVFSRIIKW